MALSISYYNTISSLLDYEKQLDLTYNKFFLKSLVESNDNMLVVNTTSLYNKYYDYILTSVNKITLKNNEFARYKFQPKLLCYDLYGSTELWALLLKVNNFNSVCEFNSKNIKVFNNRIFEILNEILIIEESNILENLDSIGN